MQTYDVVLKYTAEQLANILCSAVEGGSNYWLDAYDPVVTREFIEGSSLSDKHKIKEYIKLELETPNPEDVEECSEPAVNSVITHQLLAEAIAKLNNDPKGCDMNYSYTFDYENHDAGTADLILQVAVFGKVIYG